MTTRELQQKLLTYYKENLAALPEDFLSALDFCDGKEINMGICRCAKAVFFSDHYGAEWIEVYTDKDGSDWGKRPQACQTLEEIKQALQLRIDILEQILQQPES